MTERWIALSETRQWQQALAGLPHAAAHTHAYCLALSRSSRLETRLLASEDSSGRVACPLSVRAIEPDLPELVSPYGFGGFVGTGDVPALVRKCNAFCRGEGFVTGYIQQHPVVGPEFDSVDAHRHASVFALDLTAGTEQLLANMDQSHRYELRRALRDGPALETDPVELKAALRTIYPPMVDAKGAASVYRFCDKTLDAFAGCDGSFIVGAARSGKVVAVALFLATPWVAEYFIQAFLPEGRADTRRLIWAAVEHYKARGIPVLHLGGGIRARDSLESFKRRFGGRRVDSMVLKQIYDRERFEALSRRHATPATTEGFFPAYWKDAAARP